MRDLRKDLRRYIDLRRALGYKLRKHEPRLTEFIGFLEAQGTDRITTKLAVAWATESSQGHKHSCCERLRIVRSFARHVSSMDARTEVPSDRHDAPARIRASAIRLYAGRDRPAHGSGAQIVLTARTPLPYVL